MLNMKQYVAAALLVSGITLSAQSPTLPVTFTHQIRQFVMTGDDTEKVDMTATLTDTAIVFTPKKRGRDPLGIDYTTITSMVYDRRSRVRKMGWGNTRAEDHFLTIQYKPAQGPGDFIEVEMGKDTAPRMLATLEARSGKKIERVSGS